MERIAKSSLTDNVGVNEVRSLLQVALVHCVLGGFDLYSLCLQVHPHVKLQLLSHWLVERHPCVFQRRHPMLRHWHLQQQPAHGKLY